MSTIPTSLTEKQFNQHVRSFISTENADTNVKSHYTRCSITSCIDCIQDANDFSYPSTKIRHIQKKRNQ